MILEPKWIDSFDGTKLKALISEKGSSVWIVVTHGLGEHCERHQYFVEYFAQYFNILFYDLRGHGESEGKRAYVESFDDFCKDLSCVIDFLRTEYSCTRYMLFGHSMGGLITSRFMQRHVTSDFYPEKVYLSSPPVAAPGVMGEVFHYGPHFLINSLRKLPFSMPLKGTLDLKKLSHDIRVYNQYIKDPKNCLAIESKLLFEIVNASKDTFATPLRINCDLYVSVGSEDKLVSPNHLVTYFKNVEKNAELNVIKGGYHELHNEIEKYRKPHMEFMKNALMGNLFD